MSVYFSSFSNHALSYLRQDVVSSLNVQQKKIIIIVTLAIACVAACFAYFCQCLKKDKKNSDSPDAGKVKVIQNDKLNPTDLKATKKVPTQSIEKEEEILSDEEPLLQKEPKKTEDESAESEKKIVSNKPFDGKGAYIDDDNGWEYEGEFKNGRLNGEGKITLTSGTTYEGKFSENQLHGQGKITYSAGSIKEGEFRKDDLHGQGKITDSSGNIEKEGEFKFGHLVKGIRNSSDKSEEGEFKHDKLIKGKITFEDGTVWEGEFKNEKLHGQGKKTMPDGTVEQGIFEEGALV